MLIPAADSALLERFPFWQAEQAYTVDIRLSGEQLVLQTSPPGSMEVLLNVLNYCRSEGILERAMQESL